MNSETRSRARNWGVIVAIAIAIFTAYASAAKANPAPPVVDTPATTKPPVNPGEAFTLPPPTGPHQVGTVALHLVDRARTDPWASPPKPRELMTQIWYPARPTTDHPTARWMSPATATHFQQVFGIPGGATVATHARTGAPVAPRPDGWPTILYSHGFSTNRALATTMLEDLASRGYVVVAIDHTHDAAEVEFPDGRLETAAITLPTDITAAQKVLATAVEVRTADVRFVLDQLAAFNAGHQPDVVGRSLPGGLRCAARTAGVGVLGHSLGGATAASLMHADKRVVAGVNLDGFVFGPAPAAGLRRPFLQIGTTDHGLHNDPSWAALAANSRGWHRELRLTGARHMAFTDLQTAVPQLAPRLGLPAEQVTALLGTLAADRSVAIQRAYVSAFFDLHLRHQNRNLLDRPSPEYPEIVFVQP